MHHNHSRLLQELKSLFIDPEVQSNIDTSLRKRVVFLLSSTDNNKKINSDRQVDMSLPFSKIVIQPVQRERKGLGSVLGMEKTINSTKKFSLHLDVNKNHRACKSNESRTHKSKEKILKPVNSNIVKSKSKTKREESLDKPRLQTESSTLRKKSGNYRSFIPKCIESSQFVFSRNNSQKKVKGRQILKKLAYIDSSQKSCRRKVDKFQTQEIYEDQRNQLQLIVALLKDKIKQEHIQLKKTNQSINQISNELSSLQKSQKRKKKKVTRECKLNSDDSQLRLSSNLECNQNRFAQSIREEQYLILMYEKVIGQLSGQIKEEKKEIQKLSHQLILQRTYEDEAFEQMTNLQKNYELIFGSLEW